jgi:hypothetical protein
MPMDDLPPSEQVIRIVASALNSKKFKGMKTKAESMVTEINTVYSRAMNKIVFDHILHMQEGSNKEMFALLSDGSASMQDEVIPKNPFDFEIENRTRFLPLLYKF